MLAWPRPEAPCQPSKIIDKGVVHNRNPPRAIRVSMPPGPDKRMERTNGSRVAKCLPEIPLDTILWRQIKLLKEIRSKHNAPSRFDLF